ncbi:MAG: endolytic transglycosylase MltG [Pseudomonadota bacterium]
MLRRFLVFLLASAVIGLTVFAGWLVLFVHKSVVPPTAPFEISIEHGSTLKGAAREIAASGMPISAWQFELMARLMGKQRNIKAGTYEVEGPITPFQLLSKIRRGDATQSEITFIEGSTFVQIRKLLANNPGVKQVTAGLANDAILKAIGAHETNPEGLFFPDTYIFSSGMSDIAILKRAYHAMQTRMAKEWDKRATNLPYKTSYEALIMASIVEKETGKPEERRRIAGVFVNRLKRGMKLQTDPTVIYGMGAAYDGNIHKRNLTTDTAYNTYTRLGLPPTPIAMPGLGAIEAALRPALTEELYFVSKGDGSHYFSKSLEEHNRAVAKYQK